MHHDTVELPFLNLPAKIRTLDERFMARALALAARGWGLTSPNPAVGAVIVKNNRIVGEGFHHRAGSFHAEREALRQAGPKAKRATLYVTLEPCNHTGRTPPCCDAILDSGISRVVVGVPDPNPITNGKGISRLKKAGIKVALGVLKEASCQIIEPFDKAMTLRMPWVLVKIGQSLDGKIATSSGQSKWITSSACRKIGHAWRARMDALLVGIDTILADDPLLSARGVFHQTPRPIKVILDSRLRIPLHARCLSAKSPAPTLVATTQLRGRKQRDLMRRGVEIIPFPSREGRISLKHLCRYLAGRGIQTVLIEGGGEVIASALAEKIVDRIAWFVAPVLLGGREAPSSVGGRGVSQLKSAVCIEDMKCYKIQRDLCIQGRVVYP
ncbi:MAG: bifunctional diaminohydroxyphosphoribosylaminopyrimidine deaminase/5-amino-6-(5-phosphoribosylamino)uracil reductase RibD [Candidatus Omnitrophica bacterium]|nr:bifunctional diaminohydroxyphosphoribosylaminopyrimidine deaminase/5-amino-6-(5-phosphoribosylamino)uracil reductase RibD [Candidatus Omnitrophota bacterium]